MSETRQHEFDLAQTSTLDDLTAWMKIVAVGAMLLGVFDVLSGGYALTKAANLAVVLTLFAGVMWIVVGFWMWGAAKAMKAVTMTEGNDMAHFMAALSKMQKVYFVQAVFVALNALVLYAALFG